MQLHILLLHIFCHTLSCCSLEFVSSFENKLSEVFKDLHDYHSQIEGRLKAEHFKVSTLTSSYLPAFTLSVAVTPQSPTPPAISAFG